MPSVLVLEELAASLTNIRFVGCLKYFVVAYQRKLKNIF